MFSRLLECKPEESILDLCCGQGRHCLQMARLGFRHLYGYDRSHYLIQKARSQAKKEGLPVTFKEGDARKLSFADQSFEVVMLLGNSFGYFDSAQQDVRVLKEVARVLKPDGRILLDLTDGDYMRTHFKPRSWEWLDQYHFVCRERALSADEQRLICREILTHTTKGVLVDQFYAERLYSPESITLLLQEAGFAHVVLQGNLQTGSQRNQDVGMMERRLIATAVANKEPLSSQLKDEAYYREPARMSNTW